MKKHNPIPQAAQRVFKGKLFEVWQWEQKMFDGSTEIFERLKRPNTAFVIAIAGEKILILDQEQPDKPPFVSLPGGRCDWDEEPLHAAERELMEETGYASEDWTLLMEEYPMTKIEWVNYTFAARDATKQQEPAPDPGEKLSSRFLTFDEFLMLSEDTKFFYPTLKLRLMKARYDTAAREALYKDIFGTKEVRH